MRAELHPFRDLPVMMPQTGRRDIVQDLRRLAARRGVRRAALAALPGLPLAAGHARCRRSPLLRPRRPVRPVLRLPQLLGRPALVRRPASLEPGHLRRPPGPGRHPVGGLLPAQPPGHAAGRSGRLHALRAAGGDPGRLLAGRALHVPVRPPRHRAAWARAAGVPGLCPRRLSHLLSPGTAPGAAGLGLAAVGSLLCARRLRDARAGGFG